MIITLPPETQVYTSSGAGRQNKWLHYLVMSLSQVLISNFSSSLPASTWWQGCGARDNLMSRMLQCTIPAEYHLVTYLPGIYADDQCIYLRNWLHPFLEDFNYDVSLLVIYGGTRILDNNMIHRLDFPQKKKTTHCLAWKVRFPTV